MIRKFAIAAALTVATSAATPALAWGTHQHYCNCGHSAGAGQCTGSSGGSSTTSGGTTTSTTSGGTTTSTTSGGTTTSTSSGGTAVPEPGMLGMMAMGLIGIGYARRRQRRA